MGTIFILLDRDFYRALKNTRASPPHSNYYRCVHSLGGQKAECVIFRTNRYKEINIYGTIASVTFPWLTLHSGVGIYIYLPLW